jgi:hypothetical protein
VLRVERVVNEPVLQQRLVKLNLYCVIWRIVVQLEVIVAEGRDHKGVRELPRHHPAKIAVDLQEGVVKLRIIRRIRLLGKEMTSYVSCDKENIKRSLCFHLLNNMLSQHLRRVAIYPSQRSVIIRLYNFRHFLCKWTALDAKARVVNSRVVCWVKVDVREYANLHALSTNKKKCPQ